MKDSLGLLIFFFCGIMIGTCQISYEFNYLIEYEHTSHIDSLKKEKVYYLTNSKDSRYIGVLREKDSLYYDFYFRDNKQLTLMTQFSKVDFERANVINNDCNGVLKWNNELYKKRNSKFKFERIEDTLMGNNVLKRYKLSENTNKRKSKNRRNYHYFVLKDSTDFHSPFFEDPLDYEAWLKDKPFVSSIFQEFGKHNKKKGYYYIMKLVNIFEIKKRLQIPQNCEQLN